MIRRPLIIMTNPGVVEIEREFEFELGKFVVYGQNKYIYWLECFTCGRQSGCQHITKDEFRKMRKKVQMILDTKHAFDDFL